MSFNWSLLLDVLMIGLLGGTIFYMFVLNQNLNRLRSTKAEFETTVQKLTASISHAETSLRDLKLGAQEVGGNLETQVATARGLTQELQFMIASADSLATRLSQAAESGGKGASELPKTSNPAPPTGLFGQRPISTEPPKKPRSRAEAQLLEDLGRVAEARVEKGKEATGT